MAKRASADVAVHEVDPLIPILNLVCMLIPLLIFGAVFVNYHTLEVAAPPPNTSAPPTREAPERLHLSVMITQRGFYFRVNPKYRLAWMKAAAEVRSTVPDIPKGDDGYDYKMLKERLTELKAMHPTEQRLVIGAEDDVAYDVIIRVMDASRGQERELFPSVQLTNGIG